MCKRLQISNRLSGARIVRFKTPAVYSISVRRETSSWIYTEPNLFEQKFHPDVLKWLCYESWRSHSKNSPHLLPVQPQGQQSVLGVFKVWVEQPWNIND